MRKRKFFCPPVLLVLSATAYVYYMTVFVVVEQWLSLKTATGLLNALAFSGITALAVFCYVLATLKDPGRVPDSYTVDMEEHGEPIQEVKRKGGDLRYCQKCANYKPPRTHHCRVCKICVLRMDHHCLWINNCVGHENYKAFFLFVVYIVAACIYALILFLGNTIWKIFDESTHSAASVRPFGISYILCLLFLIPLTLTLVILLGWHVYLLSHNKTTIEYHEGVRTMWLSEKEGRVYRHPYDLGLFQNLVLVLGPNLATWFCPTTGHIGSGLRFQTYYEKDVNGQSRLV